MLTYFICFTLVVICYVYFGYPFLLFIITKMKGERDHKIDETLPSVSLIIAAYNEEDIIAQKMENVLTLDYPSEKLEIIVASDGSTDKTNEIIRGYSEDGVKLNIQTQRRGKTSALNHSVKRARGEIIVFSDANGLYKKDAIKKLVRHFSDPEVGCVCGQLEYEQAEESLVGSGESLYWRYEVMLKKLESRFNSLVGANGSIFAIRKNLYTKLDDDVLDDLATPLMIYTKGYRTVYEPKAISVEKLLGSLNVEFNKKVRIVLRQLVTLWRLRRLLNPLQDWIGFQLMSHKVLRTFIPLFLILIFLLGIISNNPWVRAFLILQVIFYLMALGGLILHMYPHQINIFLIPFYFCIVNLAALVAIAQFISGKKCTTWETVRRT